MGEWINLFTSKRCHMSHHKRDCTVREYEVVSFFNPANWVWQAAFIKSYFSICFLITSSHPNGNHERWWWDHWEQFRFPFPTDELKGRAVIKGIGSWAAAATGISFWPVRCLSPHSNLLLLNPHLLPLTETQSQKITEHISLSDTSEYCIMPRLQLHGLMAFLKNCAMLV